MNIVMNGNIKLTTDMLYDIFMNHKVSMLKQLKENGADFNEVLDSHGVKGTSMHFFLFGGFKKEIYSTSLINDRQNFAPAHWINDDRIFKFLLENSDLDKSAIDTERKNIPLSVTESFLILFNRILYGKMQERQKLLLLDKLYIYLNKLLHKAPNCPYGHSLSEIIYNPQYINDETLRMIYEKWLTRVIEYEYRHGVCLYSDEKNKRKRRLSILFSQRYLDTISLSTVRFDEKINKVLFIKEEYPEKMIYDTLLADMENEIDDVSTQYLYFPKYGNNLLNSYMDNDGSLGILRYKLPHLLVRFLLKVNIKNNNQKLSITKALELLEKAAWNIGCTDDRIEILDFVLNTPINKYNVQLYDAIVLIIKTLQYTPFREEIFKRQTGNKIIKFIISILKSDWRPSDKEAAKYQLIKMLINECGANCMLINVPAATDWAINQEKSPWVSP